jgi:hypothetical protein
MVTLSPPVAVSKHIFRDGNKNCLLLVMVYSALFNNVFKALSLFLNKNIALIKRHGNGICIAVCQWYASSNQSLFSYAAGISAIWNLLVRFRFVTRLSCFLLVNHVCLLYILTKSGLNHPSLRSGVQRCGLWLKIKQ